MKNFREQKQACIDNETLFVETCPTCGQDQFFCRKYGGICVSEKCHAERKQEESSRDILLPPPGDRSDNNLG